MHVYHHETYAHVATIELGAGSIVQDLAFSSTEKVRSVIILM